MSEHVMSRLQLLAAEIYAYSYANYIDHLGMGHVRYDNLMPEDAELLERAVTENWDLESVATAMEVNTDVAENLLSAARRALEVVDAENPAESFRNAVRQVVRRAAEEGLENDEAIEQLVIQICYRVSDLAYLLKRDGNPSRGIRVILEEIRIVLTWKDTSTRVTISNKEVGRLGT